MLYKIRDWFKKDYTDEKFKKLLEYEDRVEGDCCLASICVVTGESYKTVARLLKKYGTKKEGITDAVAIQILTHLGYCVEEIPACDIRSAIKEEYKASEGRLFLSYVKKYPNAFPLKGKSIWTVDYMDKEMVGGHAIACQNGKFFDINTEQDSQPYPIDYIQLVYRAGERNDYYAERYLEGDE